MRELEFAWHERESLGAQLRGGFRRISTRTASHGKPIAVTLWRLDGSGLQIQSRMHDVAERLEVGVLEFMRIAQTGAVETALDLPKEFAERISVNKLLIDLDGPTAESGVALENRLGEEIIVVAGAYPYTLAISAPLVGGIAPFEPEYPLAQYRRVALA